MENIAEKTKEIIANKLSIDADAITPDKSFVNDLGADSLDTVEIIMELENNFGISIAEADAEKIKTVGDAITYLENTFNKTA
jgi:acyl carrier protein